MIHFFTANYSFIPADGDLSPPGLFWDDGCKINVGGSDPIPAKPTLSKQKTIKRDKINIEHIRKQVKQKGHFKNPFNSSSCSGHWENGGKMEAKCYVKEIFPPTSSEVNTWKPQISTWKWPKAYTYKQTDKGVLGMERHQLVEASSEAPHFNPKVLTLWFPVVINQ